MISFIFSFLLTDFVTSQKENLLPFETWTQSQETLDVATTKAMALYDASFDEDVIWIMGGEAEPDKVYQYYWKNNTISYYDTMGEGGAYSLSYPYAALVNGNIYFIDHSTGEIGQYDIAARHQSQNPIATISSVQRGGLTKHPNNTELYISGQTTSGTASNQFYIYSFETSSYSTGPSLNSARIVGLNLLSSNYYPYQPYLYIFGGDSPYIERLNLNNAINNQWELLSTRWDEVDGSSFDFDTYIRYFGIASFENYVILMCGWDGSSTGDGEEEIFVFDVTTHDMEYVGTFFPVAIIQTAPIFVYDRIYVFGGMYYSSGWNQVDTIYYSNQVILPTINPSILPTESPSGQPTTPPVIQTTQDGSTPIYSTSLSKQPTDIPTDHPTNEPSEEPTKSPSDIPTDEPTIEPTDQPTDEPTHDPTDEPTRGPTKQPSDKPTSSPIDNIIDDDDEPNENTEGQGGNGDGLVGGSDNNDDDSNDGDNNNNNNSNKSNNSLSESSITIIIVGVVSSVCCLVMLCVFGISMWFCLRKETIKNKEIEFQNKLFNNMYGIGSTSPSNPMIRNNGINGMNGMEMLPLRNNNNNNNSQQQSPIGLNKVMSNSMMFETMVNQGKGEQSPSTGREQRARMMAGKKDIGGVEKAQNGVDDEVEELYLENDRVGRGNNNNNEHNAVVNVDGNEIKIDYKDLVKVLAASKNDKNNGDDTTMVAGEDIDIQLESD